MKKIGRNVGCVMVRMRMVMSLSDIVIQPWSVYVGLVLVGVFSGLGNAVGQYLFQEHFKKKLKKIGWWKK